VCPTVPLATIFLDVFNMTRSLRNPLFLHMRKKVIINQSQLRFYNEMAQSSAICVHIANSKTHNNTCVCNNYNIHFLQRLVWRNTIRIYKVFSFLSICYEVTCHNVTLPAPCIRSQMNLYLCTPAKSIGVQVCILDDESSAYASRPKQNGKQECGFTRHMQKSECELKTKLHTCKFCLHKRA